MLTDAHSKHVLCSIYPYAQLYIRLILILLDTDL